MSENFLEKNPETDQQHFDQIFPLKPNLTLIRPCLTLNVQPEEDSFLQQKYNLHFKKIMNYNE